MHVRNIVCVVYVFCVCLCLKYLKYLKINTVRDISMLLLPNSSVLNFYC